MSAVARTWTGRVPASQRDAYVACVRATGLAELRATAGNRSAWILARTVGEVAEVQVVSTWESEAAMRAFAGEPVDVARYYPEDAGYLLEMPERISLWEIAAGDGRF